MCFVDAAYKNDHNMMISTYLFDAGKPCKILGDNDWTVCVK